MAIDSAYTSVNQVASAFTKSVKHGLLKKGNYVLDYGGGKYDTAMEWLEEIGILYTVYDPYHRTKKHNRSALSKTTNNCISHIYCNNVLNVIKDDWERDNLIVDVLTRMSESKSCHTVVFSVYEGNRSGIPSRTTSQLNYKTADYKEEILLAAKANNIPVEVTIKYKMIIVKYIF